MEGLSIQYRLFFSVACFTSTSEILVTNPLGLPTVKHSFFVIVSRLAWHGVFGANRVGVLKKFSPCAHEFLHVFDLISMFWVIGKILDLMGIFFQIEKKLMINLWIDMEFPLSVINTSLVILKG
jgi:hypothetical protein